MPTIAEIRQKYPQYNDLSDDQLATALHQKFYSDMPKEQFQAKIGMTPAPANLDPAQIPPRNPSMSFREGLAGTVGNMLNGIPIAGPALLGVGERLAAAKHSLLEGTPYSQALEDVQTKQENFSRDNPNIARSGQAAGAIGSSLVAGAAAPEALGMSPAMSLPMRSVVSGTTGAAVGGLDALARGQDPLQGIEVGGTFGALAPAAGQAAGAGVRSLMRSPARSAAPALDDLRSAADTAFKQVDASGAVLRPAKVNATISDIATAARGGKINPTLHPDSYAALQDLAQTIKANPTPTISDVHQWRQIIGDAASGAQKPADRRVAKQMLDALDNNLDSLNAFDVTGSQDPKAAVAALRTGMDNWRRMRKGEQIAQLFENAKDAVGANYTSAGMETALRQQFRALAKSARKTNWRGWSPEEQAAITTVVRGGPLENTLRLFGKFAPRGVVSVWPTIAAAHVDMGLGAGLAAGAFGAKAASSAMNMNNARIVDEMVRRGGPGVRLPLPAPAQIAQRATQALSLGVPLSLLYPSPPLPATPPSALVPK